MNTNVKFSLSLEKLKQILKAGAYDQHVACFILPLHWNTYETNSKEFVANWSIS